MCKLDREGFKSVSLGHIVLNALLELLRCKGAAANAFVLVVRKRSA